MAAWNNGAKSYLCGSAKMAAGVKDKLVLVVEDAMKLEHDAATEWANTIMEGRLVTGVFE